MSVLSGSTVTPAQQAANQVRAIVKQLYQQLNQGAMLGYRQIWNNPNATPQEVIAELATDAVPIFQFAGLNIDTVTAAANIGGITPPTIPSVPAGWTLTPNQDGSMTVTPPPTTKEVTT